MAEELTAALVRRADRGIPRGAAVVFNEAHQRLVAGETRRPVWRSSQAIGAAAAVTLLVVGGALLGTRLLLSGSASVETLPESPSVTVPPTAIVRPPGVDAGPADHVFDLAMAPDGSLWAATQVGVVRWDLATLSPTIFTESDGLGGRTVTNIAVASDGTVWALGDSWLAHYDGTWTLVDDGIDPDRLTPVGDLAVGPDGAAWVAAAGNSLFRIDAGGATTYIVPGDWALTTPWARSVAVDPTGTVWASTWESGVLAFDGEWRHYGVGDGLPSDFVGNIAAAPDGTVWLGGDGPYGNSGGDIPGGGIARFDGIAWTSFTTADGLLGNSGEVAVGPDGDIWVIHTSLPDVVADSLDVYLSSGLSRYDGTRWVGYPDVPAGPRGGAVPAGGTLWLVSGDGIVGFDGTTTTWLVVGLEGIPPPSPSRSDPDVVRLERVEGLEPVRLSTSIGEIEFTTWVHPDGEEPPWGMTETVHGVIGGLGPDGAPAWSADGITWTDLGPAIESARWPDQSVAFGDDAIVWSVDDGIGRATWDGVGWTGAEILYDPRLDGAVDTVVGPHGIVVVRRDQLYHWDGTRFAEAAEPPDPSLHPGSSSGCTTQDRLGWSLATQLGPVVATDDGFIALASRSEDDSHSFPVCQPLVWFSTDGNEWQQITPESPFGPGAIVRDVAVAGGRIVAVGSAIWVSEDGITWERSDLERAQVLEVAGSARGWIAVDRANTMWFSPDGGAWDGPYERPPGWEDIWHVVGVAMLDDRIIGVGELNDVAPEASPASAVVIGVFVDD